MPPRIQLQNIAVTTPFIRLRLQGTLAAGTAPQFARIRLTEITVTGDSVVLSDIYVYNGTDWRPVIIRSWDNTSWR